jgi:hypothetical protein
VDVNSYRFGHSKYNLQVPKDASFGSNCAYSQAGSEANVYQGQSVVIVYGINVIGDLTARRGITEATVLPSKR